ncbi:MAG TPA: hemolysin family protein [Pirellulaceae bacterium]|nr:hemolysin family protein [Pirellulaceae bacterium]
MWGFEMVVMTLMIGVNAIFAAYEIALASATPARLRRLSEEHRLGAHDALHMKENMEGSLAVVQLGITLVGAVAAAVGGAGAGEKLTPWIVSATGLTEPTARFWALACLVVPLTIITIIFGELVPKVFALRNTEAVCLRLSPPMRWFSYSVWPAVWFFETSTTAIMSWGERRMGGGDAERGEMVELQDLRAVAALARASRLIGRRQEGIILGAAEMQSRPVGEIMLPAEHISTMDANGSLEENLIASHLDMHTRFPVEEVKGDPQTIAGYVNVKDLIVALRANPADGSFRSIIRPIPELQASQPILASLERLMQEHTHIAIVRDARQRVVGMVTIEDIIEELVGDIRDEYDRLPNHLSPSGKAWVVGGGVALDRFNAVTGFHLSAPDSARAWTVSDWAAAALGREVRGGDIIEADEVRLVVRKVRRQRLQEASCVRTPLNASPPAKGG